jgi:CRP-like cAMP-binding protein/DNA-binding CsgD family transcriptional regulator
MGPARSGEAADILDYLPHSTLKHYSLGKTIYSRGQPAIHLYLVVSGRVRVYRTIPKNSSLILDVYARDEIFGESALLDSGYRPDVAVTLENTELMMWTAEEFRNIVRVRPQIGMALAQILAQRLIDFGNRSESLTADDISQRLARVLIRWAERLGRSLADGSVQINGLGHELLAEYVFASRASVTHWLKHFRRKGMLDYSRNRIRILPSALTEWLRTSTGDSEPSVTRKPAARAPGSSSGIQILSRREIQIMDLVSEDLKNKEIARRLRLSEQTVKNHLQHSFEKLGAVNRRQAARRLAELKERAGSLSATALCATTFSNSEASPLTK